jgi:transposase-like protein
MDFVRSGGFTMSEQAKKWTMPIHRWREALNHFTILWPDRMPALERVTQ